MRGLRTVLVQLIVLAGLLGLPACGAAVQVEPTPAARVEPAPVAELPEPGLAQVNTVTTEASRDGVFTVRSNQRQALLSPQQATLGVGEGVDVDANGRAILRFEDLLTVEVLREGQLVLQELSADEESAFITVLQNAGTLLNDFNPEQEIERRFTVLSEFAVITATGTRFLVVNESNSPLEWVVALDAAAEDLEVTAEGVTKPVSSGMARWIAPIGEPSAGISADMTSVDQWVEGLRSGQAQREIGEVLWSPADVLADTSALTELPEPGQGFDLQNGAPGAVQLTLDPQGLFGSPTYGLEDCNGDGLQDIVIQAGKLLFDFRPVLARVRALDVTVLNRDQPGSGSLRVLDPGRAEIASRQLEVGPGEGQVFSQRSDQPYHYAELALTDGCFLGFSLTPPEPSGDPGEPRPAVADLEGQASTAPPAAPFVRIDQPADGSGNTSNGFVLSGEASVPFERQLTLHIETGDGELIQQEPLYVEGGDYGGPPGFFRAEVLVDYPLPAEVRLRVQDISPRDGSVATEDTVLLQPLLPAPGQEQGDEPPEGDDDDEPDQEQGSGEPLDRPAGNGRLAATLLGPAGYDTRIEIDGNLQDWAVLNRLAGGEWTELAATVYDDGCASLYPNAPAGAADLAGRVRFAYDRTFLYVAFLADDEGYVPYSGDDQRFFRGDAPQLLLDTDLAGDFEDGQVNADDLQVDLLPGQRAPGYLPRAGLWQLESLTARDFGEARVAAGQTNSGYFVEAALPWKVLGIAPQPGLRLGLIASLSDNDTPGTNVQECMISTAPDRNWQDPTTWGMLVLGEE